ncbi:hypothetical protein HY486_00005 [Candidatus Woesearchaeota archaeon]|nr:hypothetical protein [Candidatus Woesearchaeota archaeon]
MDKTGSNGELDLSVLEVVEAMREGFRNYGTGGLVNIPSVVSSELVDGKKVITIVTEAKDVVRKLVVKKTIVESWVDNKKSSRDTRVVLYDSSGRALLNYSGDWITNARTGAAAALSAYWLLPERISSLKVAIIGTGAVASEVVKFVDYLLHPKKICFGSGSKDSVSRFSSFVSDVSSADVEGHVIYSNNSFSDGADALLRDASVLVVANKLDIPLPSHLVSLMRPHRHIAVLSGDKQQHNLEGSVLVDRSSWFVFDSQQRARETSEVRHLDVAGYSMLNVIGTIGDVALGKGEPYRSVPTIYDSSGMGVSDLILASAVAKKRKCF